MPNLLPGEGMGPGGFRDQASMLVGSWSYLGVVDGGTEHELGNCPEGVLTCDRTTLEVVGTSFPQRTAAAIVTRVGMKFSGQANEIHRENLHVLMGDAVGNTSLYIYHGPQKECRNISFSAKRTRSCDLRTIEAYLWKVQPTGLFQLGSSDGAVATPFEFIALDDTDGTYGGSAGAPLGYIYVPEKAA